MQQVRHVTFLATLPVMLLLLLLGSPAANAALFDSQNRIVPGNEPPELIQIKDSITGSGPMKSNFIESRKFPFKSIPVELKGQSAFFPGKALLLHYQSPEEYGMLLQDGTLTKISPNGETEQTTVPPRYENLFSLYNLDLAELEKYYDIYFESGKDKVWQIGLEKTASQNRPGKAASVQTRVMTIVMSGQGNVLTKMQIQRGASISITISMQAPEAIDSASDMEELSPIFTSAGLNPEALLNTEANE